MTLPPVVSRTNVPVPTANATTTTLQIGTYNAQTDTFTLVLDLNDASNFYMKPGTLKLPQPPKYDVRSMNPRTPGERIVRVQRKNITVSWTFSIRGANAAAISANIRNFAAAVENTPYVLRLALPGASFYSFLDIRKAVYDIPGDPILWNAKSLIGCTIALEGGPAWRGDRLTVQNLISNPGFEAPAGGTGYTQNAMPLAFNDPFTTLAAYTTVSGGAMTLATANTWVDAVMANLGTNTVKRWYRLGEASGTVVYDISGNGQAGTTHASPTQGTAGLVSGDTDHAYTFAAASSQYVSVPTSADLPSANAAITLLLPVQIAAAPSATAVGWGYGDASTLHKSVNLGILSTGKGYVDVGGGGVQVSTALALTTAVPHLLAATWDGTTLTLWLDGASAGTATPGAQTIAASPTVNLGASNAPGNYFNGILDEAIIIAGALTSTQIANIWTAFHSGATGTLANAATVPASGISSFGSPVWGGTNGIEQWQVRFRWVTGLSGVFYLHRADTNNKMWVEADATALLLMHQVGGTNHQLASATVALTHEAWYWLQITQFPTVSGGAPWLQATLFYDNNGAVGSQIAQVLAVAFDGVTAVSGVAMLGNSGAALVVGGVASGAGNQVQLFGPGGWSFSPAIAPQTGQASGAWDFTPSHTFPNGPWTSFASARIDIPPAGTVDARWGSNGLSLAQTGIPIRTAGDTLAVSAQYMTNLLLSANATVSLHCNFYTSAFVFISSADPATAAGVQSSWAPLSGTVVTPASAAYMQLDLRVLDTAVAGESAGASVWFDNVEVYNVTQCGQTSMPYSELRYTGSPAQIQVSGLQGDVPAPAMVALGTYTGISGAATVTAVLGRRAAATAGAQLVQVPASGSWSGTTPFNLDPKSLGGFYLNSAAGGTGTGIAPAAYTNVLEGAYAGVYHVFMRFLSQQAVGNIANLTVKGQVLETNLANLAGTPYLAYAQSIAPLAASATWTAADSGQLTLPVQADNGVRDGASMQFSLQVPTADSTSGGSVQQSGWVALVPVDGSLLLLVAYSTIIFLQNSWAWLYSIGAPVSSAGAPLSAPVGWNRGATSAGSGVADRAHFINSVGSASSSGVNSSADPYITLDPTQQVGGTSGINQLVGFLVDAAGTQGAMLFHVEMEYTPLYLYPR